MKKKNKPLFYRMCYRLIKFFYLKYEVVGEVKKPGSVIVANHAQVHGPLGYYFYFPGKKKIWVIGEMFNRKEVTEYAMEDFWRHKSKYTKWLYKLFSITIFAPIGSYLFNAADTIPVYKDGRLRLTIRKTIETLDEEKNVIIFPEYREPYNDIVNKFQLHFVDAVKSYKKKTGRNLYFYPTYICRDLKKILIGEPILFDEHNNIEDERNRIISYLQDEITNLALTLPRHQVIPYVNNKKKNRKYSKE